jgi:tRNA pseudouridine-54 N-methylase
VIRLPAASFAPHLSSVRSTRPFTAPSHSVSALQAAARQRNVVILSHNVSQDVADGLFEVNNLLHGRVDVLARCANAALWVSNGIRKDTTVFLMLFPHNVTIEIQGAGVRGLNPNERTMALHLQRTLLIGNSNRRRDGSVADEGLQPSMAVASEERRAVELVRLTTGTPQDPDAIVNPAKPGSRSKSQKKILRVARKEREAAVRRLNGFKTGDEAPAGFYFHRNESLGARLAALATNGPILIFNELGDPLWEVLREQEEDDERAADQRSATTTLVLANQRGYAASDEKMLLENDALRQVSLGPLSLLTSQCITIAHHYLDLL